jgi:hypothetical protein
MEGSCEHGNEPSGSIKCWDYFLSGCAIGSFSRTAQLHHHMTILSSTVVLWSGFSWLPTVVGVSSRTFYILILN